jgi:hypothetical protein
MASTGAIHTLTHHTLTYAYLHDLGAVVGQSADCVMVFIEHIIERLLAFDDSA